eukprot:30967-Pelagococcus_subviridis.AAC.3
MTNLCAPRRGATSRTVYTFCPGGFGHHGAESVPADGGALKQLAACGGSFRCDFACSRDVRLPRDLLHLRRGVPRGASEGLKQELHVIVDHPVQRADLRRGEVAAADASRQRRRARGGGDRGVASLLRCDAQHPPRAHGAVYRSLLVLRPLRLWLVHVRLVLSVLRPPLRGGQVLQLVQRLESPIHARGFRVHERVVVIVVVIVIIVVLVVAVVPAAALTGRGDVEI